MKIRRLNLGIHLMVTLLLSLALCVCAAAGGALAKEGDPLEAASTGKGHSEILVAFFSATGTTRGVAKQISSLTGADLYEILPAIPYLEEDLNYSDRKSRATREQNDKDMRPEIGSEELSLEGYHTLYLGYPIWWGEEPRILDTFVETYSFDGIRVIPFCTSGGSGIGSSADNLEALSGTGSWLEGERFGQDTKEEEVKAWLEKLQKSDE